MPEAGKQRFPTWWQALILVLGGGVLGFTSCGGAFSASPTLQTIFVVGIFVGAAAFFAGLILFIVVAVQRVRQ